MAIYLLKLSAIKFQTCAELEESELMTLAGKISSVAMQIIAVQKLGFDFSEVQSLSSENRENQWIMKFQYYIDGKIVTE